jgi:hypothetical protein
MQRDVCGFLWGRLRFGRAGWWLACAVALACAGIIACRGASEPSKSTVDVVRELGTQLSGELRSYRDTGAEASLEDARATCLDVRDEYTKRALYSTYYGQALNSACDAVDSLGVDPKARVETAISLTDVALQILP